MNNAEAVKKYIIEELISDNKKPNLTNEDSLIDSNIVDSLGIQKLILFIEKEFKIKVLDEDVVPENFKNIDAICVFIDKKRK